MKNQVRYQNHSYNVMWCGALPPNFKMHPLSTPTLCSVINDNHLKYELSKYFKKEKVIIIEYYTWMLE